MYDKVYENVHESHIVGGKSAGFSSIYRAGSSGDGKSATNYVATTLNTFAKQKKTGWFCHNHTSYTEEVGLRPRSIQVVTDSGNTILLSLGDVPPEFGFHATALEQAFKQASSSQMQISVELAEVFKTSRTIVTVVKEFLLFIIDAKKALRLRGSDRRRFISRFTSLRTDDIASFWMAFRFGIRPLVYGVESVLELHNKGVVKPLLFHGSGVSNHQFEDEGYTCSTTVRSTLTYAVTDIDKFVSQQLGITSSDIVSTLWELQPLSWALDYILPVGDYIQSLSRRLKNPGVSFVNHVRSRKSTAGFSSSDSSSSMVCYGQHEATNETMEAYFCQHYIRTVSMQEPYPPFVVPMEAPDVTEIIDLIALATGVFKGRTKKSDRRIKRELYRVLRT